MSNSKYNPSSSEEVKAYRLLTEINMLKCFEFIKENHIEKGLKCFYETKKNTFWYRNYIEKENDLEWRAAIALCIYYTMRRQNPVSFTRRLYNIYVEGEIIDKTGSFQSLLKLMKKYARKSRLFGRNANFRLAFKYPETGIIDLPWKYIHPCDGFYELYHPNHYNQKRYKPYIFKNVGAKEDFKKIDFENIKRLWIFRVNCLNGRIIEIVSFIDCTNLIQNELGPIKSPNLDLSNPKDRCLYAFNQYANNYNQVKQKCPKGSEYFSHLILKHNYIYDVKFCIEKFSFCSSITTYHENAYLFVIGENDNTVVVVYENENEDRATYIFAVDRDVMDTAIESIVTFFSSCECNKRETLSSYVNILNEHGVTRQGKIEHGKIYTWKREINNYLLWWLK